MEESSPRTPCARLRWAAPVPSPPATTNQSGRPSKLTLSASLAAWMTCSVLARSASKRSGEWLVSSFCLSHCFFSRHVPRAPFMFSFQLSATDLPEADLGGSADPYVVFMAPFFSPMRHQTPYKPNVSSCLRERILFGSDSFSLCVCVCVYLLPSPLSCALYMFVRIVILCGSPRIFLRSPSV